MGFYEDDRIRWKNVLHNQAYSEYSAMKRMGFADDDIIHACKTYINASIRNEIYLTVLKIVGRSHGEDNG